MSEIFEFRGVDNLYVAKVIKDDATGYQCEAPYELSKVAEIGKEVETSSETKYYNNMPMLVINAEGADTISITLAPIEIEKLSKIIGKSYDSETGMLVDGARKTEYYALMYRTKGTDGKYRYVSRLKGSFNIPAETSASENDGTDSNNQEVEFTGIFTAHKFNKGFYDGTTWQAGEVKGIVVDDRKNLANVSTFFESVQTPDTISTNTTLGSIDISMAEGTTATTTQVDAVTPMPITNRKLVYKVGATAETVAYDQALTTGWTNLVFDTDINATEGQIITVAEVLTTGSKARKVGTAEVVLG